MIDAGMTVARFNFSHGNHEVVQLLCYHNQSHGKAHDNLMEALKQRPGKHVFFCCSNLMNQVAVMLDTKGPEIRTGYLVDGKNITIEKDSIVEITTDYSVFH